MSDDEVEEQLMKAYDSIQKHFKVNIRDLRSLKRDRAVVAHHPRRNVEEQQNLLEKARRMNMSPDFEYKKFFYSMIEELDEFDGKFHRISS